MGYKAYKNSCQWSGIDQKRAIPLTIDQGSFLNLNFKTIVKKTIVGISVNRPGWPSPLPGPADYRGKSRRREKRIE